MLEDFLDRFNERIGVPAQEPESAYRPTDPQMCMDGPMLQTQSQGGQGQHRDVSLAHT